MKHALLVAVAVSIAAGLAGCEKPQTATGRKSDAKPWQGAPDDPFVVSGWKPGDQASWDEQLRVRAQSQNEYNRVR
jgi:hypothetical protein